MLPLGRPAPRLAPPLGISTIPIKSNGVKNSLDENAAGLSIGHSNKVLPTPLLHPRLLAIVTGEEKGGAIGRER